MNYYFVIPHEYLTIANTDVPLRERQGLYSNGGGDTLGPMSARHIEAFFEGRGIQVIANSRANNEHVIRVQIRGEHRAITNAAEAEAYASAIIERLADGSIGHMVPSFKARLQFVEREWIPRLRWNQDRATDKLMTLEWASTPLIDHPEDIRALIEYANIRDRSLPTGVTTQQINITDAQGDYALPVPGLCAADDPYALHIHLNGFVALPMMEAETSPTDIPMETVTQSQVGLPSLCRQRGYFLEAYQQSLADAHPTYNTGLLDSMYYNPLQGETLPALRINTHLFIGGNPLNSPVAVQMVREILSRRVYMAPPASHMPKAIGQKILVEDICGRMPHAAIEASQTLMRTIEHMIEDSPRNNALTGNRGWVHRAEQSIESMQTMRKALDQSLDMDAIKLASERTVNDFIGMRGVERIEIDRAEQRLNVYTTALKIRPNVPNGSSRASLGDLGRTRKGGKYEISFSLAHDEDPRVRNLTRVVNGTHHPHIQDYTCWGSMAEILFNILGDRDYAVITSMVITYLETCNLEDPWGRTVGAWPLDDDSDTP